MGNRSSKNTSKKPTPRKKSKKFVKKRLTIGYFTPSIQAASQKQWIGIVDAAREHNVNLICFPGGSLQYPDRFHAQDNIIYELASRKSLDGIISWASALGNYVKYEQIKAFHQKYQPLPIVTLGETFENVPAVVMDSYQGMRDAIVHLIDVHGFKRLAFIRGPEEHVYAKERYRAYIEVLKDYNIPFKSNLVTPAVDWLTTTGIKGMELLLDERRLVPGIDFEAVVVSCDHLLIGVMQVLQSRGIKVPRDVALIGFDNIEEVQSCRPPVTTLRAPYYKLGKKAVEILLSLINGKQVGHKTVIPVELIIRQSCGCFDSAVMQAAFKRIHKEDIKFKIDYPKKREQILRSMQDVMRNTTKNSVYGYFENLLDSFISSLENGLPSLFLRQLDTILQQLVETSGDTDAWQNIISAMQKIMLQCFGHQDDNLLKQAENLWHQARVMIGKMAALTQAHEEVLVKKQYDILHDIGSALLTTFDLTELIDVLCMELAKLDITGCYLSLYQYPQNDENKSAIPEWSQLSLAYNEREGIVLKQNNQCFNSQLLIPTDLLLRKRCYSMVIMPLYFRKKQIGFILFEVKPLDGKIYTELQRYISSALEGALLVERVQKHSAEVQQQKYILDTFMASVPDRIYFKDNDSRFTKVNKAFLKLWKGNSESELIGKSDFDLFPEELAWVKFEQEQEIIRTGKPLLSLEESDGEGAWVLTTKMPLRSQDGKIIGTFGISRDITALKKAQEELVSAHRELKEKNEQLKEMNVSKDKFFSIISHDLRNMFAILLGYSQLLDEDFVQYSDDEIKMYIGLLRKSSEYMYNLIENLLTWSRIKRGIIELNPVSLDLHNMAQENIQIFLSKAYEKQIMLNNKIEPELYVYADYNMVNTILSNLLSNALKFTPQGGFIEISAKNHDMFVEVSVADTGLGIQEEDMSKLFRIDVQFTNVGTMGEKGTGLGLSLCKELVEKTGGRIWVKSEPGKSTIFSFTLPKQLKSTY